jgi:hypothetical protein
VLTERSGLPRLPMDAWGLKKGFSNTANPRLSSIMMFDVTDPVEQDRVIEILREARQRVATKPIRVGFVKTHIDRSKPPERAVSWETVRELTIP